MRPTFSERSGNMERAAIEKDVSDEALMSDLASGQQDAIGLLYARYAPTILGMAAQALGRPAGEDIVQEVFLEVWKNASQYDSSRGPVRPWLLQIATTGSPTSCAAAAAARRFRRIP